MPGIQEVTEAKAGQKVDVHVLFYCEINRGIVPFVSQIIYSLCTLSQFRQFYLQPSEAVAGCNHVHESQAQSHALTGCDGTATHKPL